MVSRERLYKQRRLELYSKLLIPIPLGILIPIAIGLFRNYARDPSSRSLLEIPSGLFFWVLVAGLFQILIGLPTISALRGKPLLAHLLTGIAIAIVVVVSQGFRDLGSKFMDGLGAPAPDKFSSSQPARDRSSDRLPTRHVPRDNMIKEEATFEEMFIQIRDFGLSMMFGYFLVWTIFTSWPNALRHRHTTKTVGKHKRPFRNLRGEVWDDTGTVPARREKTHAHRTR